VGINTGCRCKVMWVMPSRRVTSCWVNVTIRVGVCPYSSTSDPATAQRRRQLCIGQAPAKQGPSLVGGQDVLG